MRAAVLVCLLASGLAAADVPLPPASARPENLPTAPSPTLVPENPLSPAAPDAPPADHGARLLDDEKAGLPFAEQLALRITGALGFASFLAALPLGIISPGASWVSGGGLVALSLSVAAGAIGGWLGFQAAGLFISNPTVWRWVAMGAVLVIGGLALAGAIYIDVTDPCRNGSGTFQQCVVLP